MAWPFIQERDLFNCPLNKDYIYKLSWFIFFYIELWLAVQGFQILTEYTEIFKNYTVDMHVNTRLFIFITVLEKRQKLF